MEARYKKLNSRALLAQGKRTFNTCGKAIRTKMSRNVRYVKLIKQSFSIDSLYLSLIDICRINRVRHFSIFVARNLSAIIFASKRGHTLEHLELMLCSK